MKTVIKLHDLMTEKRFDGEDWKARVETDFIPDTWATVQKLYTDGFPEGIANIQHGLEMHVGFKGYDDYHDVCGQELDIPAYIAKIPECFVETKKVETVQGKEIPIKFNIGTAWYNDAKNFGLNMGTMLGVIDDMEKKLNYKFSLVAVVHISRLYDRRGKTRESSAIVEIELDKNILSDIAIIAQKSFVRRIVYSFIGTRLSMVAMNGNVEELSGVIGWKDLQETYHNQEDREEGIKIIIDRQIKEYMKKEEAK